MCCIAYGVILLITIDNYGVLIFYISNIFKEVRANDPFGLASAFLVHFSGITLAALILLIKV